MGNWRTVNVTGTMSAAHSAKLLGLLDSGPDYERGWDKPWACLTFSRARPGLYGLGEWPRGPEDIDGTVHVNRCGNLAERGYSVGDVTKALEALVYEAPSMLLKIHCGGDWESDKCVATISVGEGLVVRGEPEVEMIEGPSEDQVMGNLLRNLYRLDLPPEPGRHPRPTYEGHGGLAGLRACWWIFKRRMTVLVDSVTSSTKGRPGGEAPAARCRPVTVDKGPYPRTRDHGTPPGPHPQRPHRADVLDRRQG